MRKMFQKLMQPIKKTHAKNSNTEFFLKNGRNISQSLNHYINAIKNNFVIILTDSNKLKFAQYLRLLTYKIWK